MLSAHPDETRRALDVIEHAGEQALGEMRRLLGLLREDEPELTLAPPPSLRRLDELVAGTRASGLPVEVVIEGEPVELPPGVDVSAYRIVQEALTNALKHAGPAHARVTITCARDAVDLAIVDDGPGVPSVNGGGYGLAGMPTRKAPVSASAGAARFESSTMTTASARATSGAKPARRTRPGRPGS
jgi:signal transduction histidine kinase